MSDMLVKLYELPPMAPEIEKMTALGVTIRRVLAPEKHVVLSWIDQHFSKLWVSECDVAFSRQPPTCFIATENETMLGFACFEATQRNFFGPTGVAESQRGRGVGRALLLACLHDMRAMGYGYAIIGYAGPKDYYRNAVGAVEIPDSIPGIYRGLLSEI